MEVLDTVFEVIDMRSFSNLWYWIALAVLWSSTSHWVLGVPHDMIQRARREGGQAQRDLEDIVGINARRLLSMVDKGALVVVALGSFWLTGKEKKETNKEYLFIVKNDGLTAKRKELYATAEL